jgi:hypothetical protein
MLALALAESGHRGFDHAEINDLLVCIARDRKSAGYYILEQCGIGPERLIPTFISCPKNLRMQSAQSLSTPLLELLKEAKIESKRQQDQHIGTEHIILAMSRKKMIEGVSTPAAEAALRRWHDQGMPRERKGFGWRGFRNPLIATAMRPIQKIMRFPGFIWDIFGRKSLAHPKFVTNPHPLYRWLRDNEPVRRDPLAPVWILTRYDDVAMLMREPKFRKDPFASERLPKMAREQLGLDGNARSEVETVSMLFLDPPEHTRVRGSFVRAFTPRTLSDLRPKIERMTSDCLDAAAKRGQMDLIADLAYPMPVMVIAELLGFPARDYSRIKKWSDDFAASLSLRPTPAHQAAASNSRREIREYFEQIVAAMPAEKSDSLVGRLVAAKTEPGALNHEEIFSNAVLLLAAGHETTTNMIGNGVLALMRNREQWELLVRQPELIESAIEEILRYDPPVQWVSRGTIEPTPIGTKIIPEGEIILGCIGAANRDPARFANPDVFDIRRQDNRHLSFGLGIHYCIGAALARMEAEIAIRGLVQRFPKMRMESSKVKWIPGLTFRGVRSLRLKLTK